jgi:two-component system, NtrC family, sensor histidine kinase PilS
LELVFTFAFLLFTCKAMFSLDEKTSDANLANRILTLIVGRLFVIFLLLVAAWVWNAGFAKLSLDDFPRGLFLVFVASVGLTILYFVLLRFSRNLVAQLRIQFLLDAVLITWLVWRTGDLNSPYITLYTVLICVASLFLGLRGTLITTVLCVASFTFLTISTVNSLIPSYSIVSAEMSKAVQLVGFHDIAMLVVGFLAAKLAERRNSTVILQETTKDLANLRALHERIVESIRSGLVTTDLDGKIYTFNATAEEITGYKFSEVKGWTVFDLLGDVKQPISTSLEAAQKGEQPPRFEIDFLTPETFAVRLGYGISPLFDEEGVTTGLILTFQDLTEIRSMEESVRRKDRLAAVGRVAAGLAHEIRNPLGAMRGAIQVLQMQTPPESSHASLMDIILRESDRLNNIITNFLTYARPRVSNFVEIDLCEAINDSFTLLKHSPDVKENHVLEVDLPTEPILLSADSTQLKQVFWNLTRNAIMAMPNGGNLHVKVQKLSNGRTQILFNDTGCGMTPKQVEQLFEPFSTSTTGGTGLGLSIVYQIVRDHGGTIKVRSLEGKGSTITVELPSETRNQPALEEKDLSEVVFQSSRLENFLTITSKE